MASSDAEPQPDKVDELPNQVDQLPNQVDQLQWIREGGSNVLKKPCVRNSLMAGIATGSMMGIHKFRVGRTVPQACVAWGFTFVVGSSIHMMACSFQLRRKYEEVERQMDMRGAIHASKVPELR